MPLWREDTVSTREFKYIKLRTKAGHPCPHCIPAGAYLSFLLIWEKNPNSQALFLGLIVCDIHNTASVNGYLSKLFLSS